jgi:HEAT repeat protein
MHGSLYILLAAAFATSEAKPGDVGTPDYEKAAELVKQLGDSQFTVREAAGKRLIELEFAAVPALKEGLKSSDEEIRSRCESLLPKAKAAGWKRRCAPYVADADSKRTHELPLLADWQKLTGKHDVASRKHLAEVLERNGDLLSEAATDRKMGPGVCASRCTALLEALKTATKGQAKAELADVSAVLLLDATFKSPFDMRSPAALIELLKNPSVPDALGAPEAGKAFRKLIVGWAEAQSPNFSSEAYVRFADLARKTPFAEAVPALIKLAQSNRPRSLAERLLAIDALGMIGGKDAAAALAGIVPNDKTMFEGDMWKEYREGDSALAASLKMHGKRPEDYGLIASKQSLINVIQSESFPIDVYGFRDADARTKAVAKWKEEVVTKGGPPMKGK